MKKLILFLLFFKSFLMFSQEEVHGMGLLFDDEAYEKVPKRAASLTRDYRILPSSYSLKQYAPTPGNQGNYGTCVAWSSAYAARTIAEAIANGWTDKATINSHTFSPMFVYSLIKNGNDIGCNHGSCIEDACEILKNIGVPLYDGIFETCRDEDKNSELSYISASNYKIDSYVRLFDIYDSNDKKIRETKKALSENQPVVIGMRCFESFRSLDCYPGEPYCWYGNSSEYVGGHALCVVGYDDNKYGGAFEIMNSWGTHWGNNGFVWVKYEDYALYTKYGFSMYVKPKQKPIVIPDPPKVVDKKPSVSWMADTYTTEKDFTINAYVKSTTKIKNYNVKVNGETLRIKGRTNSSNELALTQNVTFEQETNIIEIEVTNEIGTSYLKKTVSYVPVKNNYFAGRFYIQLSSGDNVPVEKKSSGNIVTYKSRVPLLSGTRYRIYLSNNEPAYVYVICSDLTDNVTKLFPQADNISAALNYKSNNIALPDEDWYIEMDDTRGTDYICMLYSQKKLPINDIIAELGFPGGSFSEKLKNALSKDMVWNTDIKALSDRVSFSAKTDKTIIPIIVEIEHK